MTKAAIVEKKQESFTEREFWRYAENSPQEFSFVLLTGVKKLEAGERAIRKVRDYSAMSSHTKNQEQCLHAAPHAWSTSFYSEDTGESTQKNPAQS